MLVPTASLGLLKPVALCTVPQTPPFWGERRLWTCSEAVQRGQGASPRQRRLSGAGQDGAARVSPPGGEMLLGWALALLHNRRWWRCWLGPSANPCQALTSAGSADGRAGFSGRPFRSPGFSLPNSCLLVSGSLRCPGYTAAFFSLL